MPVAWLGSVPAEELATWQAYFQIKRLVDEDIRVHKIDPDDAYERHWRPPPDDEDDDE